MRLIKFLLFFISLAPTFVFASTDIKLDKAPIDTSDDASLQRGAQSFVNYCLTCHGASYMRYNRHQDIGLSNQEISERLILTGQKVGDVMFTSMKKSEAEEWFGVAPPDLSVIARSRGADWLYTYLRSFYRDESSSSGWNNLIFDKVAMPHVLYQLQGLQTLNVKSQDGLEVKELNLSVPGLLSKEEYDNFAADLVNYIVYLGEPHANYRKKLGAFVLIFLLGMLGLTYLLKREYWRDVH
ncbi:MULTISPECIES: cytochrome c1 [Nitrosomonas]|uniref:Cytochrome C n=1 Tax=Nitrosomonas communis TaxID=44574 RepID=A0A0F7KE53_9PROT|nr:MULTISPECIES: cytochrome c1 [Nitrosomonas]AKH37378.1 cytochrome C [Nitrosomonas communis]TYP91441.1 ubiquinol-cytochrome c reductase cytochrome c1 subunit [Nitrosomonas communis]UVS62606.1 cytochrome c1 [Nitrosomonas sp. PLL12]